jgi:tRNA (cmo5U34)-methyltransferase
MAHSVRRHLDVQVTAYDQAIRRFIPGYDDMLVEATRAVSSVAPAHVIDLGAGTGALAEAVLGNESVGTVELLDVDPEMLDQARSRLADAGGRARFTPGSYFDPLPPCDAVCASLSLHHIPSLGDKADLYRRIHDALRPGGVFVNADVMVPAEGPERDAEYHAWVAHNETHGIAAEEAWSNFAAWAEEDTYHPVEIELELLRQAGFEAECTWRAVPLTILVARRS